MTAREQASGTEHRNDTIERLYRTGNYSLRDLAARFSMKLQRIDQILNRRNVPKNKPHQHLVRDKQ